MNTILPIHVIQADNKDEKAGVNNEVLIRHHTQHNIHGYPIIA